MTEEAYYNEIDPQMAKWLRVLIQEGHIAPGVVDERSIEDVIPYEIRKFTQCHFFAGIGVWSYALRQAGWRDDRRVWTGSCPCQPFSQAGKGAGFADERHLWPAFYHLIKECDAPIVFGEQVASKSAGPWIDLVQADMEALGRPFGAIPFPAAGVGAPHIRDRLYWMADTRSGASIRSGESRQLERKLFLKTGWAETANRLGLDSDTSGLAHAYNARLEGRIAVRERGDQRAARSSSLAFGLADTDSRERVGINPLLQWEKSGRITGFDLETSRRGPVNGFWRSADWLGCRDDRWRPVEPGTFPLVDGASARVGRLRGYGNAINAEAAKAFIQAADDEALV